MTLSFILKPAISRLYFSLLRDFLDFSLLRFSRLYFSLLRFSGLRLAPYYAIITLFIRHCRRLLVIVKYADLLDVFIALFKPIVCHLWF